MTYIEAMIVLDRMCAAHKDCQECPIRAFDSGECDEIVLFSPERVEAALTEWAAKHPEEDE